LRWRVQENGLWELSLLSHFSALFPLASLTPMSSRQNAFPSGIDEPVWRFPDDSALKAHPAYRDAKAGEVAAAVSLVTDLALPFLAEVRAKFPPGACFVAPHAREAAGDNAIPQVLSQAGQ
jgi:hypothetical protein